MRATKYPKVRQMLAESYRHLPDRTIERVLAQQGLEAGAIEDFWDDLGNIAASALPAIGGAVGSIVAPGVGTAIGAGLGSLAGGALHSAIGSGQPPAPPQGYPSAGGAVPQMPPYVPPYVPPAMPGMQPGMQQQASSQQLAAVLMQLLTRPDMLKAILAMLLGNAGAPTVPVGNTPVPIAALTNLLSTVASQASEAYNNERGGYGGTAHYTSRHPLAAHIDLASQEARSAALLNLMRENDRGMRGAKRQRLANVAQALRMASANGRGV